MARELRAKAIGEGANLAITQAGRIEFAQARRPDQHRLHRQFSAGVDCSDNEVNIKIPLNREMAEGRLALEDRNALLAEMTDEVADDRARGQSAADAGAVDRRARRRRRRCRRWSGRSRCSRRAAGSTAPSRGSRANEELLRRGAGESRPHPARARGPALDLEDGAAGRDRSRQDHRGSDARRPSCAPPSRRRCSKRHGDAILQHRLRREIIATKIANRFVNRLGITAPFALAEEEGASFGQVAAAFVAAERLFEMESFWERLDTAEIARAAPARTVRPGQPGAPAPHRRHPAQHVGDDQARRDGRQSRARPRRARRRGRGPAPPRGGERGERPPPAAGRARRARGHRRARSSGCSS